MADNEQFPTCTVCGEENVEDAGGHAESTGHWPTASSPAHPGYEHDWVLTEDGYIRTWSTQINDDGSIDATFNGSEDWSDEGDGNTYLGCSMCPARKELTGEVNYV